MLKTKELAQNTLIIILGKLCTQCIGLFLLPLYTAVLTTQEYGTYDLLNTYIALFVPLVTLQIEQALFRFLVDVRRDKEQKQVIISTVMASIMIQCLVFSSIYLLVCSFIELEYEGYLLLNIIISIVSGTLLQMVRGLGDNLTYTIASFITAIATIIFNLIFIVAFRLGTEGMLLAYFLGHALCVLFIVIKKRFFSYLQLGSVSWQELKEYARYSMPLVPNVIAWWVINASDRSIIVHYLGMSINGLLAIASKFSAMYMMFFGYFNISWTESAALHIWDEDGKMFISNVIVSMFKAFSAMYLCVIAVMPFAFPILIHGEFHEAYNLIPILLIGAFFNVVIGLYSVIYVAYKKTKELAKTSILAGAIKLVVNLLLIRSIGLYAAPVSTLIAFGTMMLYRYYDIRKYMDARLNPRLLLGTMLISVFVITTYYINNVYINIISLGGVIIYSYFLNGRMVMKGIAYGKGFITNIRKKYIQL